MEAKKLKELIDKLVSLGAPRLYRLLESCEDEDMDLPLIWDGRFWLHGKVGDDYSCLDNDHALFIAEGFYSRWFLRKHEQRTLLVSDGMT